MMRRTAASFGVVAMLIAAAALLAAPAAAQPMGAPPNALQGFAVNRDKPTRITSATLEVRDKEKKATFSGNVVVAQGDTTMKSATLDVFYDQDANAGETRPAVPGPADQQQIRRLEAKGGVVVTQRDQTATGENGIFDMPTNTVELIGNVVITQGAQIVRGERLKVDMTTGVSEVYGGVAGVQAVFTPNAARGKMGDREKSSDKEKAADNAVSDARNTRSAPARGREGTKQAPKAEPGSPLRLN
jgi:lipopolysaccharide export system protein LptA